MQSELFTLVLNFNFSEETETLDMDGLVCIPDSSSEKGFYTKPVSGSSPLLLDGKYKDAHQERTLSEKTSIITSQGQTSIVDFTHIIRNTIPKVDKWYQHGSSSDKTHEIMIETSCYAGGSCEDTCHHWFSISIPYFESIDRYHNSKCLPISTYWLGDSYDPESESPKITTCTKPDNFRIYCSKNPQFQFSVILSYYIQSDLVFKGSNINIGDSYRHLMVSQYNLGDYKRRFIGCNQKTLGPSEPDDIPNGLNLERVKSNKDYFYWLSTSKSDDDLDDEYDLRCKVYKNITINFTTQVTISTNQINKVFDNCVQNSKDL